MGPHALPLQARCVLPLLRLRSPMLLRSPTTHTTHEGAWYSTKRRIMTSMTRNKYFGNSMLPAARCGAHVWHAAPGLSTHCVPPGTVCAITFCPSERARGDSHSQPD